MRTVFLVPRRSDAESGSHRDKVWAFCRKRWELLFPGYPIYEGHHDEGLFNRAAAINRAARLADVDGRWDQAIIIDSDVLLPQSQVEQAIDVATETGHVTWAHRRWRNIREDWTLRIVADKRAVDYFGPECDRSDIDIFVDRTNPISWSCCFVVPRAMFNDAGGFDERFRGWGFEDLAWQSLVVGLYGHERIEGDVLHMWHPRSEERIVAGEPAYTASPQYLANGRLGRRYMYALRRDYGRTDRQEPANKTEIARDLANLEKDDHKFALMQSGDERRKWDGWWPTLEELRDGAKEAARAVTVIVHTGGTADKWPERRAYLERSLASLTEKLRGPIVQRVIYDCWGDPDIRAELEAMGKPHGFYVAGPAHRPDFTESMGAMWRYLAKRGKAPYIFQTEDDFVFEREVDLLAMVDVLMADPKLVQMALLRDACYPDERETGGILGWPEHAFTFRDGWFEHRQFWTNNPSLFHRSVAEVEWPKGRHSETLFGKTLFADPAARAAFWGDGVNWITHIGEVRAGTGY